MKCKNIECNKETTGKRVYCSLSCRNVYVNKYMRSYDKTSKTLKAKEEKKREEKENEYLKLNKKCKRCGKIIKYSKKNNNYCNISCSNRDRDESVYFKQSLSIKSYIAINGTFGSLNVAKDKIVKTCINCGSEYTNKNTSFCDMICKKEYGRKDVDKYSLYKVDTQFKFALNDYPNEFDFSLIEKYGWYSPSNKNDNLNGASRDHLISVSEGYELGIDPKLLAHPANCRLLKHTDNISKNKKSIITLSELLERIKIFEDKYGKYE